MTLSSVYMNLYGQILFKELFLNHDPEQYKVITEDEWSIGLVAFSSPHYTALNIIPEAFYITHYDKLWCLRVFIWTEINVESGVCVNHFFLKHGSKKYVFKNIVPIYGA